MSAFASSWQSTFVRLGIFVGFGAFFVMEKSLRVLSGGEEGHSHSHAHSHGDAHAHGASSAVASNGTTDGLRARGNTNGAAKKEEHEHEHEHEEEAGKSPSKLSAYLNLFGDFVHNMCVPPFPAGLPTLTHALYVQH